MLKTEVNIEKLMPSWASRYLESNELVWPIRILKKTKRQQALSEMLKACHKEDHLDVLYCNAKGNVVFKWETAQEKTMFMLKWG